MGKQRTKPLKRKAEQLLAIFPSRFSADFEKNKKILGSMKIFTYSKKDKNIVAGIITRMLSKVEQ